MVKCLCTKGKRLEYREFLISLDGSPNRGVHVESFKVFQA